MVFHSPNFNIEYYTPMTGCLDNTGARQPSTTNKMDGDGKLIMFQINFILGN